MAPPLTQLAVQLANNPLTRGDYGCGTHASQVPGMQGMLGGSWNYGDIVVYISPCRMAESTGQARTCEHGESLSPGPLRSEAGKLP